MGPKTLKALQEHGAVYLNAIGGAAQYYAQCFKKVEGVDFLEFGIPEAMWHLQTEGFAASSRWIPTETACTLMLRWIRAISWPSSKNLYSHKIVKNFYTVITYKAMRAPVSVILGALYYDRRMK